MSIKGTIYTEIADRLFAKLSFAPEAELPSLRWVDKENGQFRLMDQGFPIPLPAITIGFARAEYTSNGQNVQEGQATIRIRIGYESYADSFEGSSNQAESLKYYEFQEQVYAALQGFSGTNFSALERVAEEDDEDHDAMIVTIIDFATMITDTGAITAKDYVLATIDPVPEHQKNLPINPVVIKTPFVIP